MVSKKPIFLLFSTILIFSDLPNILASKSTIEPCSNSDSCNSLLGYTLYTDLKVSEVASLFQIDPISLLTANAIDISYPDKTRPSDTLSSIADSIYGGLVSSVSDPSVLDVGQSLVVPLPCTCFNGTDNNFPAIYLSYVTKPVDTLYGIASRYSTTITDLMTVNALGGPAINDGDILVIPLSHNFRHPLI
ncbi:hypothetical protein POM88_050983 [Heracleum sosnowskyi]|uniref:LysM domain-containing protein n=1 Tax=Heracleum sosnowskyi TaxID=360622 RepID=A0AAD8GYQ8_9APIA|nr:hypothetical protein POM88_050983 [Heracleum sosnowskyi]